MPRPQLDLAQILSQNQNLTNNFKLFDFYPYSRLTLIHWYYRNRADIQLVSAVLSLVIVNTRSSREQSSFWSFRYDMGVYLELRG